MALVLTQMVMVGREVLAVVAVLMLVVAQETHQAQAHRKAITEVAQQHHSMLTITAVAVAVLVALVEMSPVKLVALVEMEQHRH